METRDPDSSTVRLLEGILAEFADRCRRGEEVRVDEYLRRHPHLADELRDALPALRKLNCLTPPATYTRTPLPVSELPEQIGEYRIVGELGRGGMGIVYQAIQRSLNRRVALKVISRPNPKNDNGRERFSREARIAAQLHHSNIVPVFGAGEEGNVLFYAMQYIEGESLDCVISQLHEFGPCLDAGFCWITSPPAVENRFAHAALRVITGRLSASSVILGAPSAGSPNCESSVETAAASTSARTCPTGHCASVAHIGVQVANALAHAHSHDILHRDIKPSNLILDRQGVVWLTDFGLAQHDEEPGLTSAGDLVGTLRYLAPERFRGAVDARSDLYALGLVLYELLAFRSPFEESNRQALMGSICESELPPLRKVRRGIPPDLETIVLKATAKDPSHRYPTASELAEDLSRFLDGLPVVARPLGSWGRFWRWRQRNPVVASLAGLLLLVLLSSLSIVTWQWRRAERNFRLAVEIERTAIANASEAVHQRDRAEQNFIRARQAVDDYLTTISESNLLDVPTLEPVRAELLSRAREFYEGFVEREPHDPQLQCELAATYIRLSQVTHDLNGDWLPLFERGLTLLEQSQAAGVALTNSRSWREGVYNTRAGQLKVAKPDRLLQLLERALVIWSELVAKQPNVDGFGSDLAGLYLMRGLLHLDAKRQQLALEDFERSRDIREELTKRRPDEVKFRYELGESYAMLGIAHLRDQQLSEAWESTNRARELLEPLVRERPSATRMANILAAVQQWLAQVRLRQGRPLDALNEFRRAIDIHQRLAREYPYASQFQLNLCESYRLLGRALFDARQDDLAQRAMDDCCKFLEQRIADYPERVEYSQKLVDVLIEQSRRLSRRDDHSKAELMARRAVGISGSQLKGTPAEARALVRLSLTLLDQGRAMDASVSLQTAVTLERSRNSPPTLASHLLLLGNAFDGSGQFEGAATAYREVLDLQRAHGAVGERVVADCSNKLASVLEKLGRAEEATAFLHEYLDSVRVAYPDEDPLINQILTALVSLHQRHSQWTALNALLSGHRAFRSEQHQVIFGEAWLIALEADTGIVADVNDSDSVAGPDDGARTEFVAPAVDFYLPNEWFPSADGRCLLTANTKLSLGIGTYELSLESTGGAKVFVDDRLVLTSPSGVLRAAVKTKVDFDGGAKLLRVEQTLPNTSCRLRFWIRLVDSQL